VHCVSLALADPARPVDDPLIRVVARAELGFVAVFSAEMLLKLLAWGPRAYFRDAWNVMDFTIVSLALLAFVPHVSNVTAIRVLRLLRPLRVVNNVLDGAERTREEACGAAGTA
jgi:hypothetical protein